MSEFAWICYRISDHFCKKNEQNRWNGPIIDKNSDFSKLYNFLLKEIMVITSEAKQMLFF